MNDAYVIDVKDLTKYYGDKCVVDRISLRVGKGDIFGFLGPNGSGKTTTLRMICGLLTPDGGSGTCLGYDIFTQSLEIKRHVGYMTQKFSLYDDLSIYENLDFIARIYDMPNRKARVQESIDALGISRARENQLAGELSGGWKQRLALAAAILHDPQLLLLDEPTAGVDPKARREFWNEIQKLSKRGITTLVTTHYMDEAERCNHLAYIAYGRLLIEGTNEEIIKKSELKTWVAKGDDLYSLMEKLRKIQGIDEVSLFGNSIHVSGKDEAALEAAITPYQTESYQWQKSEPTMEDLFIYYLRFAKDNFAQ